VAAMRARKIKVPFVLVAVAALAFISNIRKAAANQPAPGGVNLYQDVMSHKSNVKWLDAPATNYPDDACNYLKACSAAGAPKVFLLPVATVDGRRAARAVYLIKVKDPKQPEAVVFEHQTADEIYFFRVGPDGAILYTAYLERGKPWLLIANQLGQSVFNKDAADWHAALSKASGKPGQ
jgi:hypothetical protein